jgi:hypothetical protein
MTGIPLTPAQHGVWFTERAGLAGAAYHLAVSVTLDGPVDLDALAGAAAGAVRAHPQLAGACVETDGVVSLVPGVSPVEVDRRAAPRSWSTNWSGARSTWPPGRCAASRSCG